MINPWQEGYEAFFNNIEENPWQEGYEAFFNNIEENPYPILSHNWYEWDSGWEQAEKEN